MGKIIILDEHTANKIAAGEVVERPASVVKELCENSIDAGATSITVEIKNGGISYLKVTDNGSGISKDDVEIAFEKHSTSKIRNADDLNSISSMGFRGEALASIAAVSRLELVTRTPQDMEGSRILVEGGNAGRREDTGSPIGTNITVRDLFFNTPARYKFLKKDYTEAGYVEDVVTRLALGHPGISFKFINSGTLAVQTPGNNDIMSCAYSIFGNTVRTAVQVNYLEEHVNVEGLAGKPETARANRSHEVFFINNRYIKNKTITTAVEEAYKTLIPSGKYPFVVLNIGVDPRFVDVNVHPTKQEVRFSDENQIFKAVYHAVKNSLLGGENLVPEIRDESGDKEFRMRLPDVKLGYEQKQMDYAKFEKSKLPFTPRLNTLSSGNNYIKHLSGNNTITKETGLAEVMQKPVKGLTNGDMPDFKEKNEDYIPLKIIGTAFATYIIVQFNDELYIIDQHAAHERVMYERLRKSWAEGSPLSQALLVPEIVELKHKELNIMEQNKEIIEKIGFSIEQFGNNAVKISAVPMLNQNSDNVKDIFLELIDGLENMQRTKDSTAEDGLLYRMACKAAVKANTNLSKEEILALIDAMNDMENPFTCPHGRPTAVRMTKRELEKKFGRT